MWLKRDCVKSHLSSHSRWLGLGTDRYPLFSDIIKNIVGDYKKYYRKEAGQLYVKNDIITKHWSYNNVVSLVVSVPAETSGCFQ